MAAEQMASLDAAWLRMDDDTQRMMITVLLRFEGPVPAQRLEALVAERVAQHPRFRQRVVDAVLPGLLPRWEDDPHFSLGRHLHRIALPAPQDEGALLALLSDLASTALDRTMPLWQLHVVEGAREGTMLVARLHHAIGDGISLVRFLLSLTDECRADAPASVGLELRPFPSTLAARARLAVDHATTLASLLAMPFEHETALRGPLGREKRVAFTRALSVDALKRAGALDGARLNDVLVSAASGAVRRHLLAAGESVGDVELRAMVPVFFRGLASEDTLGNHFGLVFAPLLVSIADPRERLRATKSRMDGVKSGHEALVSLEVLGLMGHAGAAAERVGIDLFTHKASFMITNVPGPPGTLHLAGALLTDLVVWAPVAGSIGVGLSLMSYAGALRLGVVADARRLPDPARFAADFEAEVDALCG